MFANTFQSGFISVFYSVGSNPLSLWDKAVKNGHIRRVVDDDVKSLVLELSGTNVATTYITCPIKPRASLGIKLPFLVMVIKNMKKYFTFEIQILDDKDMHRRFRVSNFQSTTKVRPFCTTMPIGLSDGWNQIQFNLADFTKRAYGSTYVETMRVQVHANVRIRRIYFSDRLYGDDEMPNEFKLFLPIPGTQRRQTKRDSLDKKKSEEKAEEEPTGAPPTPIPEEGGGVSPEAGAGDEGDGVEQPQEEAAAPEEGAPEEAKAEEAPAAEGEPPAEGEEAPAEEGATPAEGEEAPAEEGEAPAAEGEEAPPAEEGAAPAEGEEAPTEGGEAPAEGGGEPEAPPAEAPPAEPEAPTE